MSTVALCVYCESLPEKSSRFAAKKLRCPLCHCEVGVSGRGAKFRLGAAADVERPINGKTWIVGAAFTAVCIIVGFAYTNWPKELEQPEVVPSIVPSEPATVLPNASPQTATPQATADRQPDGAAAKPFTARSPRTAAKAPPYPKKWAADVPATAVSVRAIVPLPRSVLFDGVADQAWQSQLAKAPEISLPSAAGQPLAKDDAVKRIAAVGKEMRALNAKEEDGFVRRLMANRADLAGLPFLLGKACRSESAAAAYFADAVDCLRSLDEGKSYRSNATTKAADFWDRWRSGAHNRASRMREFTHNPAARDAGAVAALMQILGPTDRDQRLGLTDVLAKVERPESEKALVKIALFDPDNEVRERALDALRYCDRKTISTELMRGFRHPAPGVAHHAAQAVVRLDVADAVPALIAFLDEPDPAAPFPVQVKGTKLNVVREMVRLNHHRNCQLCHAPGDTDRSPETRFLMARVPSPADPLPPSLSRVYYSASPQEIDLVVRADITYLRQDFSLMQKVPDAKPWPEMQRFDYLVRLRSLSDEECAERSRQPKAAPLSAQHEYALAALRELTWQDHGATAAAWRRANLPAARNSQPSH